MFLLAVLIAMSGAIPNAAASHQQQAEQKKLTAKMCWADEIRNPNPGTLKPPLLPKEPAYAKVRQSAVLLKVCIHETGKVVANVRSVAEVAVLFHRK